MFSEPMAALAASVKSARDWLSPYKKAAFPVRNVFSAAAESIAGRPGLK